MKVNKKNVRSNEEIAEALKVIKDVCDQYGGRLGNSCSQCPLRYNFDECGIQYITPADWEINSLSDWKAF